MNDVYPEGTVPQAGARDEPLVRLLVKQGAQRPFEVRITQFPFRVGREPDNDLVLTDSAVSGYHFRLRRQGPTIYIDDLDSSNGTYLNQSGERVSSAPLADGTRIVVGRATRMRVHLDRPTPRSMMSAPPRQSIVVDDIQQLSRQVDAVAENLRVLQSGQHGTLTDPVHVDALAAPIQETREGLAQVAAAYARLTALYEATGYVIAGFDNLPQCLSNVLDAAIQVLKAERGFLMLRDPATQRLTVEVARAFEVRAPEERASTGIAERVAATGEPVLTMDASREFSERESVILQNIRSVLCVPLQLELGGERRDIGVLYLDTRGKEGVFRAEDKELLIAFGRLAAIAIENARLFNKAQAEERIRNQMARNLPRAVVEKLLDAGEAWGPGGDEQFVTVLTSDIRSFTSLSEKLTPQQTLELLNFYFSEMTEVVFQHEGTLDKFLGDGLMAIFGAPYSRGDDAARAVQCAVDMVRKMDRINRELATRKLPALRIGIGLNSGVAVAGNVGSARRMDYTVVGDMVNVAFRLCSEAIPDPTKGELGQIILSQTTFDTVKHAVRAVHIGERLLKGKESPQPVYRLVMPREHRARVDSGAATHRQEDTLP